jgi:hypothetical protein
MFTTIKLNTRTQPNGRRWYQSSFAISADLTDAEIIAHATKVLLSDLSIPHSTHLIDHLNNGNFIIERTPT